MTARRIIAVFDSAGEAESAREELIRLGIGQEQINIVNDRSEQFSSAPEVEDGSGSFWSQLKEMFMPDEDRATLDESLRRGGHVLYVTVPDAEADRAIACLEKTGAINLGEREAQWRAAGWKGMSGAASGSTATSTQSRETAGTSMEGEKAIPVVEEQLRVGKREVSHGSVKVRSYVVEEPVHERVRLREEHVDVERRPVNAPARPVAKGSPQDLMQERSIEMSESAEEPVVAKEAVVKEEVRLRKQATERVEDINETVRHTKVDVEDGRKGAPKGRSSPSTRPPAGPARH